MKHLAIACAGVACAGASALAEPTQKTDESAETGAFLPFSDTPATKASRVKTIGVYDGARDSTAVEGDVQAKLSEKFQLDAVLTYEDGEVDPAIAAQLSLTDEDKQGVDLQLAAGWDRAGANQVPAVFAQLSAGRTLAGTYLLGTARFDLGTEQSERGGILDAAAIRSIASAFYAGVDSRLELDLERDAMEPASESTWALHVGPVATYAADHFTITASVGLAADKPRDDAREVGAFVAIGAGAAL
ncbi:MAG TPA: hypothetical protein VFQ53_31680 [Kofleriaceae bacterium]|nr:hypothetical protein [Kofleriaceae bacterium]